jgi:hypothetical protein
MIRAARALARQHYSHPQKGLPAAYRTIRTPAAPAITVLKSSHFKSGYAITPVQIDYEYDKFWIGATNCDPDLALAYTINYTHTNTASFLRLTQLCNSPHPTASDSNRLPHTLLLSSGDSIPSTPRTWHSSTTNFGNGSLSFSL